MTIEHVGYHYRVSGYLILMFSFWVVFFSQWKFLRQTLANIFRQCWGKIMSSKTTRQNLGSLLKVYITSALHSKPSQTHRNCSGVPCWKTNILDPKISQNDGSENRRWLSQIPNVLLRVCTVVLFNGWGTSLWICHFWAASSLCSTWRHGGPPAMTAKETASCRRLCQLMWHR